MTDKTGDGITIVIAKDGNAGTKHETYHKQDADAYTLQVKARHAGVSERMKN